MASTLRTNRLTPFISLTTVMVAALSACGGNSGDDTTTPTVAAPVFPSAGFGQITALATGLIEPGTYVVAGCVPEGSTSPLQRKIRFNTDGSVQWLNAAAADAVLYTYTPSASERDAPVACCQIIFSPIYWVLASLPDNLPSDQSPLIASQPNDLSAAHSQERIIRQSISVGLLQEYHNDLGHGVSHELTGTVFFFKLL